MKGAAVFACRVTFTIVSRDFGPWCRALTTVVNPTLLSMGIEVVAVALGRRGEDATDVTRALTYYLTRLCNRYLKAQDIDVRVPHHTTPHHTTPHHTIPHSVTSV